VECFVVMGHLERQWPQNESRQKGVPGTAFGMRSGLQARKTVAGMHLLLFVHMAQDDLVTLFMAEYDLMSQPIERVVNLMKILPNEP
jgi:hypothetical protein